MARRARWACSAPDDCSATRIAELNDLCRKAMGVAGRLFQKSGIDALPPDDQSAIREAPQQELPEAQHRFDDTQHRVIAAATSEH